MASCIGEIEHAGARWIRGWALDRQASQSPVSVEIFEGSALLDTITASVFRWDLKTRGGAGGWGHCGFLYELPPRLLDGTRRRLRFRFAATGEELKGSPVTIRHVHEGRYVPFSTTRLVGRRVLALAPHPDDESLGCGGALALHRRHRDPVKVVCLTDGRLGGAHGASSEEDQAERRRREAVTACRILGVDDLEFWNLPDRSLEDVREAAEARLVELLAGFEPDLVYAPSPLEFHPDHRAAAALVWGAVRQGRVKPAICFYEVNQPLRVNVLVDITSVVEAKRRACLSYASQLARHDYADIALALNRYRSLTVSHSCDYAEGYVLIQGREIADRPIEHFTLRHHQILAPDPPLVSILIRTKDRPGLLKEALSSVLTQTYPSLEVVIVNDAGEDVAGLLDSFRRYVPIEYLQSDRPLGRSGAANVGLRHAKGKYINFLDDDDVLYSGHVEKLATYLEATGEQVACSDCERGEYEREGETYRLKSPRRPFWDVDPDPDRLQFENTLPIMTVMFSRSIADRAGPFDESFEAYEDWDYWIRLSTLTGFHRLPGFTAEYRVFGESGYDDKSLHQRIYAKHHPHWTVGRALDRSWRRMGTVASENRDLHAALYRSVREARVVGQVARGRVAWLAALFSSAPRCWRALRRIWRDRISRGLPEVGTDR